MAIRCTSTRNLEVHHINRGGGNSLSNAQVLCHSCHVNTPTYGQEGTSPPEFSQATKNEALRRAVYRCECTRNGCH